jgi:hypothetical protein
VIIDDKERLGDFYTKVSAIEMGRKKQLEQGPEGQSVAVYNSGGRLVFFKGKRLVRLHKVTLFVVDGMLNDGGLDRFLGDCAHNDGAKIAEIQTAEFDREWTDDDPLNMRSTWERMATLDAMLEGCPVQSMLSGDKLDKDLAE